MKTRPFGNSGIETAPLILGGNIFGWTVDEATSFLLLDEFAAAGFNCIDTADVYSKWVAGNTGGESESILGKWLQRHGRRQEIVIATKVGMELGPERKGLSKAYILRAVEDSLRRLQTDYIDLYQAHIDDRETPLEETLEAFAQLISQGKVRAIGASNYDTARLSQALRTSHEHGFPTYQTLQPLYNLYDRAVYEAELEPFCQQAGLGVIPYFSLASGFLTGKYRSEPDLAQSLRGSRVSKYLNARGFAILNALDQVAAQSQATPAQIALAWLIARPSVTAPIASATTLSQLRELIQATKLQLDPAAIELLDQAGA